MTIMTKMQWYERCVGPFSRAQAHRIALELRSKSNLEVMYDASARKGKNGKYGVYITVTIDMDRIRIQLDREKKYGKVKK